jgi:hypothetical protein
MARDMIVLQGVFPGPKHVYSVSIGWIGIGPLGSPFIERGHIGPPVLYESNGIFAGNGALFHGNIDKIIYIPTECIDCIAGVAFRAWNKVRGGVKRLCVCLCDRSAYCIGLFYGWFFAHALNIS